MTCSAPGRLRRDRAPPRSGDGPAARRRREPRQPALGRGRRDDPHRQPHRGREEGQPRLPRLLRQRLQRHARARAVRLGGRPGVDRGDRARRAATCARAGTAAASTRSCAAAMCVVVRDLVVLRRAHRHDAGRPAVYATFASYDEVAHHSGLERADTLEALRKLDQQFGRIDRARRYAPAPLRDRRALRPRPDPGRHLPAAQRLRPRRPRARARCARRGRRPCARGDENDTAVGRAVEEATGRKGKERAKNDVSGEDVVVLGSGNLGLIYLMDEPRRLTLRGDRRAPPASCCPRCAPTRTSAGCWCARPSTGPVALGARGAHYLPTAASRARTRWRRSRPPRRATCCAPTASPTSPTSWSTASTTPQLDEGCAFEELICFHGGMGGPQTRADVLHPVDLPFPDEPIVGAEALHRRAHGLARGAAGRRRRRRGGGRRRAKPSRRPLSRQTRTRGEGS